MDSLAAFTHRHKLLFDMDFSCVVHRGGNGLTDDLHAVLRQWLGSPLALGCMDFIKSAGKKPRIIFRFATHIPHLF